MGSVGDMKTPILIIAYNILGISLQKVHRSQGIKLVNNIFVYPPKSNKCSLQDIQYNVKEIVLTA